MSNSITHTEAIEAAHFLAGDVSAFDAHYNRYYEAVFRNALSLLKDRSAAEDIVQEVFLTLWQKRNALGKIENMQLKLYKNIAVEELRKQLRDSGLDLVPETRMLKMLVLTK